MTDPAPSLDRGTQLGLVAMGLAVLVIANDFTALSVAIPAIEKAFRADVTTARWVIKGYALVFGVAMLLLALDQGSELGWTSPRILAFFAVSAGALHAFVFVERTAGAKALIPPDVLGNRAFLGACMRAVLGSALKC